MNRETIEKAAMEYSGLTDDSKDPYARERGALCIAFKDGAYWRINDAWHEANRETPMSFAPVLAEHHSGRYSVNMLGREETCPRAWDKWAYIDD